MPGQPPPTREPTLNELNAAPRQPSSPTIFDFSLPTLNSDTPSGTLQITTSAEAATDISQLVPSIQSGPTFDEYLDAFARQNQRSAAQWWSYSTTLQGIFFPFRPEGLPRRVTDIHAGRNVFIRLPSSRYTNATRYEPGSIHRCCADFVEVSVRNELLGATIRQLRYRQARHCVPFEISLEADIADAPVPTVPRAQPTLRQYTCSCCSLNLNDVSHLSIFEKSLVIGSNNQLHLVDLSDQAYWGSLNAFFQRLTDTSGQRTIRFVSPQLKRTTLEPLAFYLARLPNVTTFVYPRTVADEFTLEACRQQLEAHEATLCSATNAPKWPHIPTSLIARAKTFVAATDQDPVTKCTWLHQRIAVNTVTTNEAVTFEVSSNRVLGLLFEIRGTSARFLARKVIIRVKSHFATDDLEDLAGALNEAEAVFAFAEEFHLVLAHTPPAIASLHEAEGFAITIAQQLSALEFALRIWLSSAPLQRQWITEVNGDLRAHRAIRSSEYPVILQKLGRNLQTPFTARGSRHQDAPLGTNEIRSTIRHLHQKRTCVISATLRPEPEITPTLLPAATWQERFRKALTFTEQSI